MHLWRSSGVRNQTSRRNTKTIRGMRTIKTEYRVNLIKLEFSTWEAWEEGKEDGVIGQGRTEKEALIDFIEQIEEQ